VSYITSWTSTINHSRTTTGTGTRTTTWETTKYLRVTADNAGSLKDTEVLSANDHGHSYIDSGVWVETT
jgi:hypothetical protein